MTSTMKLKTLQGYLQDLQGFSEPKIEYEQYETPAHIAAVALYTIQTQYRDLEGKLVLDAGCGPGILSIGASLLGAGSVIAADIDDEVFEVFKENINEMEISNVDALQCDFLNANSCRKHYRYNLDLSSGFPKMCATSATKWENYFDTVIMNPPFGTKNNSGIDMKFLQMGIHCSCDTVYSLHKTSTRSHIMKKINDWGLKGGVIAELRYDLPATYKFHRKQSLDIAVDLWRLQHPHC